MSWQAMMWAFKQQVNNSAERHTLIELANFADRKGRAWPSQENLARTSMLSRSTIQRALRALESARLIARDDREESPGRYSSVSYQLALEGVKLSSGQASLWRTDRASPRRLEASNPSVKSKRHHDAQSLGSDPEDQDPGARARADQDEIKISNQESESEFGPPKRSSCGHPQCSRTWRCRELEPLKNPITDILVHLTEKLSRPRRSVSADRAAPPKAIRSPP